MVNNYTKEIEEDIYIEYKLNPTAETVEKLALKHSKKVRSIISKLSAMGIYQKKKYISKNKDSLTKEEYIASLAEMLKIDPDLLESMEKVTKYALVILEQRVKALKEDM